MSFGGKVGHRNGSARNISAAIRPVRAGRFALVGEWLFIGTRAIDLFQIRKIEVTPSAILNMLSATVEVTLIDGSLATTKCLSPYAAVDFQKAVEKALLGSSSASSREEPPTVYYHDDRFIVSSLVFADRDFALDARDIESAYSDTRPGGWGMLVLLAVMTVVCTYGIQLRQFPALKGLILILTVSSVGALEMRRKEISLLLKKGKYTFIMYAPTAEKVVRAAQRLVKERKSVDPAEAESDDTSRSPLLVDGDKADGTPQPYWSSGTWPGDKITVTNECLKYGFRRYQFADIESIFCHEPTVKPQSSNIKLWLPILALLAFLSQGGMFTTFYKEAVSAVGDLLVKATVIVAGVIILIAAFVWLFRSSNSDFHPYVSVYLRNGSKLNIRPGPSYDLNPSHEITVYEQWVKPFFDSLYAALNDYRRRNQLD